MRQYFYQLYRRLQNSRVISSFAFWVYLNIVPCFSNKQRCRQYDTSSGSIGVRIAFICDEMTFRSFEPDCQAVFVTPSNWKRVLQDFKPEILLCESAWSGIDKYKDCWRGQIYRNHSLLFDNRKRLFKILQLCKNQRIPTVFWNKEDPTFFGNRKYDFVDTALHFDYIFTTARECVPRYRQMGHSHVDVMMFAVQPKLFMPLPPEERDWNTAVFAGSWYANQPQRCKDCCDIFDMVIQHGLNLVIYDRGYSSSDPNRRFPEKYQQYIEAAVPYTELSKIVSKAGYAININTVQDSETMFARRVFEWMACGVMIISNHSVGMEKLFPKSVWYFGKDHDSRSVVQFCVENRRYVLCNHSYRKRVEQVCSVCRL